MTTITIDKLLLEQVQDLLYRVTRWKGENHEVLTDLHDIKEAVKAVLSAPATAPDDRVKELKAELAATEIAIAEYRQQCLDNATEIARLRSESEERLQNCAALVAENEQLRWAVKDALAQLQRGDFADAESTLSVTAMKETP